MTILTKPFAEKGKNGDSDINELERGFTAPTSMDGDADSSDKIFLVQARAKRLSSASTIFLFLSALCVMFMGIIGGVAIYRAYARAQIQRLRFHGYCGVPYDSNLIDDNNLLIMINNKFREMNEQANEFENEFLKPLLMSSELKSILNETSDDDKDSFFFKQEFDLDLSDEQGFAKIDVPSFRDGRDGRFLHDFKHNESAIIDRSTKRCFVMPLDRETVLPPRSIADVVSKMWEGYYNIDTNVVRKNMKVVLPALSESDKATISPRIRSECQDANIYRLEKYVSGVFKRSIELSNGSKFAEYVGKMEMLNIMDLHRVEEYESRM